MTEFLDLPNELLRKIANQGRHDDILNLALGSQLLLSLSNKALQSHNKNRDAYFPIRFGDVHQPPYPLLYPLSTITDIMGDVEVAYYPIKIIIGDFTALNDLSYVTNANNGRITKSWLITGPRNTRLSIQTYTSIVERCGL